MQYRKGFDLLISAFSEVSSSNPDTKMIIYGSGEEKEKLKRKISELSLDDKITLLPPIPNVIEKNRAARLFVLPSRSEGIPNILIEAMMARIPTVSSDCSPGGARSVSYTHLLYAILRAMGVGEGDEVIIQGYTCVVVVNAVIYLGAKPIYVDIDQHTFNINLDNLKSKVTNNTKVIICQNTYRLSSNLEEIQKIAFKKGIYTVEDCTHGFGGSYHGIPNGTSCDASFFSTQWNKPFSTGIGGFAVIHNSSLLNKMKEQEQDKIFPNFKDRVELKMMYFIREYLVNDFTYWFMVSLYRWLSRHNLVVGSSSGEEVTGTEMPDNYFKAMSVTQMKKGIKSIQKLNEVNKIRKKNATEYTHFLICLLYTS